MERMELALILLLILISDIALVSVAVIGYSIGKATALKNIKMVQEPEKTLTQEQINAEQRKADFAAKQIQDLNNLISFSGKPQSGVK